MEKLERIEYQSALAIAGTWQRVIVFIVLFFQYIPLPNGGGLFDRCGCRSELTCTKIKRKNWRKKKQFWSWRKKKIKTQFKYRCKYIPPEPEERIEWRG